jgi:hypothetical protein
MCWTGLLETANLDASDLRYRFDRLRCLIPWCHCNDRQVVVPMPSPQLSPGLHVHAKHGICNTHASLGSAFNPAAISMDLLSRHDFTVVEPGGHRNHSRVLRYTGLDSVNGNPMQAWYIVYWSEADLVAETAGMKDTLYDGECCMSAT